MTSPNSKHLLPCAAGATMAFVLGYASQASAKTDHSTIPVASVGISSSEPQAECWELEKQTTYFSTPVVTEVDHAERHQREHRRREYHHRRRLRGRHHHTDKTAHHDQPHGKITQPKHPHVEHHTGSLDSAHHKHKKLLEHRQIAQEKLDKARAATNEKSVAFKEKWLSTSLTTTQLVKKVCPVSAPGAGGGGTGGGGVSPIPSNPIPSQTVVPPVTVPESGSSSTGNTTPTYPTYNCNDDLLNYCGEGNNDGGLDIPPPPLFWWPPVGGGSGGWPTGGGSISAAPEPDAWALIMAGVCVAGLALRCRPKTLANPMQAKL